MEILLRIVEHENLRCDECENDILTECDAVLIVPYGSDRVDKVYCMECYNAEKHQRVGA